KTNRFVERRDRVLVAGELEPRASKLGVRGDGLRKLARRLGEDRFGVSGAALTPKRDAEIKERGEVRTIPQALAIRRLGLVVPALLHQRATAIPPPGSIHRSDRVAQGRRARARDKSSVTGTGASAPLAPQATRVAMVGTTVRRSSISKSCRIRAAS